MLPVAAGRKILDVGVGTGVFGDLFAQLGASVTGVDISPRMLELAGAKHPEWHLLQGHFLSLPLADTSMDAAISSFAFHHLETREWPLALQEVFRVLNRGPFLLVDILFADVASKDAARRRLAEHWAEENYPCFPDLARCASQGGLKSTFTRLSDLHGAVLFERVPSRWPHPGAPVTRP